MSSKHTEETDVPEHLSLSLDGLSCLSAAELCCYLLSCPACLITYCKRLVCVSDIQCLCAHFVYVTTWHFCVFSGSRRDRVSLLSSSTVLLSVSFCPSYSLFSAYLSISLSFCFALPHFLSTPHIPSVFISFFLSFLSVSVSFSPVCPISPPQLFFSLSSRHKSLSCWLLKCEEWQIWWFLTAVTGVPRFTSLHCPLWSWLSDLKAKYTRHE